MSWTAYIRDKRYFLLFYALLMAFVSLILMLGPDREENLANVLYVHVCCMGLALGYLLTGFFRQKAFFQSVRHTLERHPTLLLQLPEPLNNEQAFWLEALRKRDASYERERLELRQEKKDHQEFILAWIHEVKIPIAAGRLILENRPCSQAEELADKMEDELNRIEHYVEQALYYSRTDAFSQDYFIAEFPLSPMIRQTIKKYAKLFINKQIRLNIEACNMSVFSDTKWLSYVLEQIIVNALKYTEMNGDITITCQEDRKEKRLCVIDSGIGIKAGEVHRIFEKGFTGSNGRRYGKSTGMGLYLAKQLSRKLGHNLSVHSQEGAGTTINIHFPKIQNHSDW